VTRLKAYDKTFISSLNDLNFKLKGDLSEKQFIDVKETLHYQKYTPEDYNAYSLDSYKYTTMDHLLNVTYGMSVGEADTLQLDYYNNVYRIPIDNIWEYTSNRGKLRYSHRAGQYTGLAMEGSYEEREYANDRSSNYEEGIFSLDLSAFLPEHIRYTPVSNTMRGDKSTFETMPTGMDMRKAVDHYTNWTRRPGEPDPQAKFLSCVTRGDLYLTLLGDLKTQRRTTIDNGYYQPSGTLRANYDANDQTKITFEDTYYTRKHDKESDTYFLYNHSSNKLSLSGRYQPSDRLVHILTLSDEYYAHTVHDDQDYRVDTFSWENAFSGGRTAASLNFKATQTRYGTPRLFYADSDQYQVVLGYDYPFTPTWLLHLKDEWLDNKFKEFEDLLYSSYTRHTWRVGVEKQLSTSQGLELGYQSVRERHSEFTANNIIEKSLVFSWLSHF
ncbi:MAG TPA: hypothetical protein PKM25_09585, partial [Candidatus Ozemobacteraceae bacterium]|nr:hypothetical protein [Candidatus Ozemobacteraceae bacterium]